MLSALVRLSVNRPISVILSCVTLVVLGLVSLQRMSIDYLPDLKLPQLTVVTTFPGLPSEEIRDLVTIPLEDAFSGASGLKSMTSESRDGVGILRLEYQWGTDLVLAGVQARELIDAAFLRLPHGTEKPIVLPVNPGDKPVLLIGVFPEGRTSLDDAKRLAERELKTMIQQIDGVGSLQVVGGQRRELQVMVDQKALAGRGLTPQAIAEFLTNENQDFPAGSLLEGRKELIVKADNKARTPEELRNQMLPLGKSGAVLRLGDVADIQWGHEDRTAAFFFQGREGLGLEIQRRSGYSPVRLAANFQTALAELQTTFAGKLRLEVIEDRSEPIAEAVWGLIQAILLGTGITFLVLYAFLRKLTPSLIVLFLIPFSIVASFLFLSLLGVNLNTMSLGGIDIGIGMLVDTGVVVLGNLMLKARRNDLKSIHDATVEMARPLAGATVTSFIVFLPLVFLPGLLGRLFSDLAWAVIVPLSVSYIASITLLPALYRYLGTEGPSSLRPSLLERTYRRSLRTAFRRPWIFVLVLVVFAAAGAAVFPLLSKGWLQTVRSTTVEAVVHAPAGTSMESLTLALKDGSARLGKRPEVLQAVATAGSNPDDPSALARTDRRAEDLRYSIEVTPDKASDLAALTRDLGPSILVPDGTVEFSYPGLVLSEIFPFSSEKKRWVLRFDSPATLQTFRQIWDSSDHPYEVLLPRDTKKSVKLIPRRELFAKGGLSLQQFAETVAVTLRGRYVGTMEEAGVPFDIRVWVPLRDRSDAGNLASVILPSGEGGTTVLAAVAQIDPGVAPPLLVRENRKDSLSIEFPAGHPPTLPDLAGVEVLDPEAAAFAETASSLAAVFLLALLLLYLVLGAQFESPLLPLLLMAAIPLGILGVGLTLAATFQSLNLNTVLGMLVILGALANHSIILYDILHQKVTSRDLVVRGIYEGSAQRFRPILITLLTTVFALLPTALDWDHTNPQSGLATAIIGGLSVSTLLAFYLMPLLFLPFLKARYRKTP